MDFEMQPSYIVYVLTDQKACIVAVDSSAFLPDPSGWVEIDSGYGDRYHHAQGNYFDQPIMDERGIWRYKLSDGKAVERTQEEMDADWIEPEPIPTLEQRVETLEQKVDVEMADQQEALRILGL